MLRITKKYRIEGITDAFDINVVVPDCAVVVSKTYDKITEILTVVLEYCDSTCLINYDTIRILLTYNNGYCFYDETFIITNNCDEYVFVNGGIKLVEQCDTFCGIKFAAVTNKPTKSTYDWDFDAQLFTRETVEDKTILSLKPTAKALTFNNEITTIKVTVTSDEGCVLTDTFEYLLCYPKLENYTVTLSCKSSPATTDKVVTYISNLETIPITVCKDRTVEFSKIENVGTLIPLTDDDINFFFYKFDVTTDNKVKITLQYKPVLFNTTLQIPMKVQLCTNQYATFIITLNVLPCTGPNFSLGFTHNFDCENCTNRFTQLKGIVASNSSCPAPSVDLTEYVFSDKPINWESFTFIPTTPPQVLNNAYQLTTPFAVVTFSPITQRVIYNSSGGLTTVDLILFSVANIDGEIIEGELKFKKPNCSNDIIDINDTTVCLQIGETVNNIILAPQGSTITITQYPIYNIVSIKGNKASITTNSIAGQTDYLKYTVTNNEGGSSDEVVLTIVSYKADVVNLSNCLNSIGVYGINLTDISTAPELGWVFAGYSANGVVVPGPGIGTFSVNNGAVTSYQVNDLITLNSNAYVEFVASGVYSFKTQSSSNCGTDKIVNIEIINPIGLPGVTKKNICISTGTVSLNNILGIAIPEGGTWAHIGNNITSSFNGTSINTQAELPNIPYLFTYTLSNSGLYNATVCSSQLVLEVTIDEMPVVLFPICQTLCSLGPDPIIEPNCQNIEVEVDIPIDGCDLNFYNDLNLPANTIIKLVEAPLNPIILIINDMPMSFAVNDYLPTNSIWAYYKAPLGHYKFELIYGNSCQRTTTLDIDLVKGGCGLNDVEKMYCASDSPVINLISVVSTSTCLANHITQTLGTNTTSFDASTNTFSLNAPGYWEFDFTSNIDSDDASCSVCANTAKLRITVTPLPGPGEAVPGTVCSANCEINIYPLFFNPNLSNLGVFRYDGFSTVYRPLNAICTPIWSITNGPLVNADLIIEDTQGEPVNIQPNTILSPNINLHSTIPLGYYYFSNTVVDANGCECTSQTVIQVVEALAAGTGGATIICSNNPETLDLRSLVQDEDNGGAWTVQFTPVTPGQNYTMALNQGDPGFWVGADQATFNSENQPFGQYIFKYTHTNPPSIFDYYTGCENCGAGQATVQVDVIDSSTAGIGNSPSTCQ